MKLVLNKCFGGFNLSDWAEEQMGCSEPPRDDPEFITLVTNHGRRVSGEFAALVVVEIPDSTTDYEIDEYDGFESIIYVVDGKIHHA